MMSKNETFEIIKKEIFEFTKNTFIYARKWKYMNYKKK